MRRWALLLALVLVGVASASSAVVARTAADTPKPKLEVVQLRPFDVRGSGFRPRERVRVSLGSGALALTRVARATARGSFRVSFGAVAMPRCVGYVVTAVSRAGTRATLRAKPLCPPP